jgi:hypothetical protein
MSRKALLGIAGVPPTILKLRWPTQNCRQDAGVTVRNATAVASPRWAGRAYNRGIPRFCIRIEAGIGVTA